MIEQDPRPREEQTAPAPPQRRPLVEAPLYVSGAPLPAGVAQAAREAGPPIFGALTIAILGAIAGYFVPKVLDRYAAPMLDPDHGQPIEFEIEDEGEDDRTRLHAE